MEMASEAGFDLHLVAAMPNISGGFDPAHIIAMFQG
jgi:hypothetical protein